MTKLEKGRPSLQNGEKTVKFSLSMAKSMRARIETAAQKASSSQDTTYNASQFVREAILEKLEDMGQ